MRGDEIGQFLAELDGWEVIREHHLLKSYTFRDFLEALAFAGRASGKRAL